MSKVVKSVSLDLDKDRDLVNYLDSLPRGEISSVIRAALRAYIQGTRGVITLGDVYQVLTRIESKIECGVTVASSDGGRDTRDTGKVSDAPGTAEAAANLDAWSV